MSARDDILNRLRQRLDGELPVPESDFSVMTGRGWSQSERLQRFEHMISAVHGEVIHTSRQAWTVALGQVLREKGIRTLALGKAHDVAVEARATLDGAEIELVDADRDIEDWSREQFETVDAGLTSTLGAIAETGSLFLWPTPDEPRRLSLVPPIHIAVLDAGSIHDTFFDMLRAERWSDGMPTNALLVSGPSKTADIEQTLVYGVHGPRQLVVLLRQD
ncbi:LutC/YkgG family protein [Salinicola peritrichatus]|uniref:LutC/YkgG family protein n=1 Tax=Salinicola peritrichatus TaxID=1267424 RepID=UPI000DA16863|nr:lactate utilization protein C [Salinicola peritrichatus]